MKTFNVVRYILSILIPIVVVSFFGFGWFLLSAIILLYANNVIDDIVFYYGSRSILNTRRYMIPSPVEGIVTKIEYDVPLFSHLEKTDVLTRKSIVQSEISEGGGRYSHITVFLNKFNKHSVANIFGDESTITQYDKDGELVPMVENGELIADNKGEYLSNTFVDIKYPNGVHVVLTMDKYVSKAVLASKRQDVELLICKGSQCDIYIPSTICGGVKVHVNDAVEILEELAETFYIPCYSITKGAYRDEVEKCISISGFGFKRLLMENFTKTLSTVAYNTSYLVLAIVSMVLFPQSSSFIIGLYLYMFCLVRFYKNFCYSMMNIIGYKEWMSVSYNKLNKILNYGK